MSDWLLWADVKTSGLRRPDSVVGTWSMRHGNQVNALVGLTYRIPPDLLVGAVGGWETFNYTSEALSGRMKGDGWTIGSYLGWRIGPQLRFDAASTYS
ncbi:autotransporter outer membrane beta-barrel domain-containing protein, partial [Arcobacter sp. F155]|uniref:autotransporter outer membrane beta-barrel domain-containing protein n=1 Tax=Arcobacter sp. F155 TaxID=2044512 RepID=UPI002159EF2B